MELLHALVVIFATSSGLVCIYALVSSLLLFLSLNRLSPGEDFTKIVRALFFTVFVGFIYTLWNLLIQLNVLHLDGDLLVSVIGNVLCYACLSCFPHKADFDKVRLQKGWSGNKRLSQINKTPEKKSS